MHDERADATGLAHLAKAGRQGRASGRAGVALALVRDRACAMVIARRGQSGPLAELVKSAFGLKLPDGPHWTSEGGVTFAGCGPGQWLAFRQGADDGGAFERDLRTKLGTCASVSDQTDARPGIRVSGTRARDMLAKLVPIDLDARVFPARAVAATLLGHTAVTVMRATQDESFEILVSRSYAETFWHAIVAAGAEYGIDVNDG